MAQKTVKKTTAPAAAKKAPVKKVAAKKPVKKVAADKKVTTKPEMQTCACGTKCACGTNCACGKACTCGGGCKFGRFVKKLVVFLIIFALGFAAAKLCCCGPRHHGPRMHFVNGCLDVESVKCPKMQAALPAMDINQDNCITREEFRAVKKHMRAEIREMHVQEVETDVAE